MSDQFPIIDQFVPRSDLPWLLVVDGSRITVESCDDDECMCQELPRYPGEQTLQQFATYDAAAARATVIKAYGAFELDCPSDADELAESLGLWDTLVSVIHAEDFRP